MGDFAPSTHDISLQLKDCACRITPKDCVVTARASYARQPQSNSDDTVRARSPAQHDGGRAPFLVDRSWWARQGCKFRRQQPVGPFVVDFICVEARLIVELDGAHHHDEEQFWYDYRRTAFLNALGYEVMRFNNVTVLTCPFQVGEQLAERVGRFG
jgi:hypothetical protein